MLNFLALIKLASKIFFLLLNSQLIIIAVIIIKFNIAIELVKNPCLNSHFNRAFHKVSNAYYKVHHNFKVNFQNHSFLQIKHLNFHNLIHYYSNLFN